MEPVDNATVAVLREELEAMRVALEETRVWCEGLEQRQARIAALFSVGSRIGMHV